MPRDLFHLLALVGIESVTTEDVDLAINEDLLRILFGIYIFDSFWSIGSVGMEWTCVRKECLCRGILCFERETIAARECS